LQKQVATEVGLGISHYNKIENGQREASVEMLDKLAKFYGISIDQIVHPDNEVPTEIVVEDKTLIEQVRLINALEEKDKNVIFSMLETMITKQKFKDFFNKNVAAYKRTNPRFARVYCFISTDYKFELAGFDFNNSNNSLVFFLTSFHSILFKKSDGFHNSLLIDIIPSLIDKAKLYSFCDITLSSNNISILFLCKNV